MTETRKWEILPFFSKRLFKSNCSLLLKAIRRCRVPYFTWHVCCLANKSALHLQSSSKMTCFWFHSGEEKYSVKALLSHVMHLFLNTEIFRYRVMSPRPPFLSHITHTVCGWPFAPDIMVLQIGNVLRWGRRSGQARYEFTAETKCIYTGSHC